MILRHSVNIQAFDACVFCASHGYLCQKLHDFITNHTTYNWFDRNFLDIDSLPRLQCGNKPEQILKCSICLNALITLQRKACIPDFNFDDNVGVNLDITPVILAETITCVPGLWDCHADQISTYMEMNLLHSLIVITFIDITGIDKRIGYLIASSF